MHGKQVADFLIFLACLLLYALYHVYYFGRSKLPHVSLRLRSHSKPPLDLWETARKTRTLWADDVMQKAADARGEALLGVQTMRNIVVAATLLVMGMSQIMGRLVNIMCTQSQLDTLQSFSREDPITGVDGSFAPAYVRVAVAFGFTLLSLLSFAQCVRLAVHLGFCIRVQGVHQDTDLPLREEVIAMTERCSLYFTLGLRFLFAFIAFVWWAVGTTALLAATVAVVLLLLFSDQIPASDTQVGRVGFLTKYADKYRFAGEHQDNGPANEGEGAPLAARLQEQAAAKHSGSEGLELPARAMDSEPSGPVFRAAQRTYSYDAYV